MDKIRNNKREILFVIVTFIISMLMCVAFLQPHYTQDTYKIIRDGLTEFSLERFLEDGRVFTAIITIFVDKINMSVETYMLISFIIALILFSISILFVFKIYKKIFSKDSKIINALLFCISFMTIYNYMAIEYIYYLETAVMALGVLLSVIACKIIVDDEEHMYIKASIILIIAAFCYQGSIAIFPMLLIIYYVLKNNSLKDIVKNAIKSVLLYVLAMVTNLIFCNIVFSSTRLQIGNYIPKISNIIEMLYDLIINSLGIMVPYLHIGIIILVIITLFINRKKYGNKLLWGYILMIIVSIGICLLPPLSGSGLALNSRICISFGATIAFSLLVLLYIAQDAKKWINIVVYTLITLMFLYNVGIYVLITNQHIMVDKLDKENCNIINNIITEYEEKTNIKVTKISAVIMGEKQKYYPNIMHAGAITTSALSAWTVREVITFYTGRDMQFCPMDKDIVIENFLDKDWDNFSPEQVVINNDTLYFCIK